MFLRKQCLVMNGTMLNEVLWCVFLVLGDSLSLSANMKFTTWDEDNDMKIDNNCAIIFESAWWYNNCYAADLNGQYLGAAQDTLNKGVIWDNWKGPHSSLRLTEMKIRPFGALKN